MLSIKPNYVSPTVTSCDVESFIKTAPELPKVGKDVLKKLLKKPETKHALFSFAFGINPTASISESTNPVAEVHGFVVDMDQVIDVDTAIGVVKRNTTMNILPTWIHSSQSGKIHLLYEFERPVNVIDLEEYKRLAQTFAAEVRLSRVLGGFDASALDSPQVYYTYANPFVPFPGGAKLSYEYIQNLRFRIGQGKFYNSYGVEVPLGTVFAAMEAKFPNHGYTSLQVGSRGKRFWDETAEDDTSAVIRSTGVQYFSDGGGFKPWSSIFGEAFIETYQQDRFQQMFSDMYFDGAKYYRYVGGKWIIDQRDTIATWLKVNCKVSSKIPKGKTFSELDECFEFINSTGRVKGAASFVYQKDLIVNYNGDRWVNTNNIFPMAPADTSVEAWGYNFPNVARWLDSFYCSEYQLKVFLAWLRRTYVDALAGAPQRGQCLFNIGGVHVGKTLMIQKFLGPILGGSADSSSYMTGAENFNSSMFGTGLCYVDDQAGFTDFTSRSKFSSLLKKIVSNGEMARSGKFQHTETFPFVARMVICMNDDPNSLGMLPELQTSLVDKLIMLRCGNGFDFPSGNSFGDVIQPELPYFCRWLKEWTPPEDVLCGNRFEVVSFIDPSIQEAAETGDESQTVYEVTLEWAHDYFRSVEGSKKSHFDITGTRFYSMVSSSDDAFKAVFRSLNATRFLRIIRGLMDTGRINWITCNKGVEKNVIYRITPPKSTF